jgi:hypothetical protein
MINEAHESCPVKVWKNQLLKENGGCSIVGYCY